jgi:hypothetical protein
MRDNHIWIYTLTFIRARNHRTSQKPKPLRARLYSVRALLASPVHPAQESRPFLLLLTTLYQRFESQTFTFTRLLLVGHPAKLVNDPPHPYAETKEGESETTGPGP